MLIGVLLPRRVTDNPPGLFFGSVSLYIHLRCDMRLIHFNVWAYFGGAENDGHEIAGHEIDGPSCRA